MSALILNAILAIELARDSECTERAMDGVMCKAIGGATDQSEAPPKDHHWHHKQANMTMINGKPVASDP